jgi:hypothetical protein
LVYVVGASDPGALDDAAQIIACPTFNYPQHDCDIWIGGHGTEP